MTSSPGMTLDITPHARVVWSLSMRGGPVADRPVNLRLDDQLCFALYAAWVR